MLINLSSAQLRKFLTCPKLYVHSTLGNSRTPKTKPHGVLHHIPNLYGHTCISRPTSTTFKVTLPFQTVITSFHNKQHFSEMQQSTAVIPTSLEAASTKTQRLKTHGFTVYPSTLSRGQDKAWSPGLIEGIITKQRYAR